MPTDADLTARPVLSSDFTLVVEKVGEVPTTEFTNWQSPVVIGDDLWLIDASGGKLYRVDDDGSGTPELMLDVATDLPAGLSLQEGFSEQIANIVGGDANRIYVTFTSETLPDDIKPQIAGRGGFTVHEFPDPLPGVFVDPGSEGGVRPVEDLYRLEPEDLVGLPPFIPNNTGNGYQVIYEYKITGNGLKEVGAVTAFEVAFSTTGHRGTGMEFHDGKILWATGDGLPFGTNGRFGAQDDDEVPSKLWLIDPKTGEAEVAAKGLRNVQHLEIFEDDGADYLAFADIGGVTAEELNIVSLDAIMDTSEIENFGWGVDPATNVAREGTFYVGDATNGIPGILGTQPPATGVAPTPEEGFIQPHGQYSRVDAFEFVAATGPTAGDSLGEDLNLVFGDLNSGDVFGTTGALGDADVDVFLINLVTESGEATSLNEIAGGRSDPRFFTFENGDAGVFLEETGEYYRLTEQTVWDDMNPA